MMDTVRHIAGLLLALWFGWVFGLSIRAVKFTRNLGDSKARKVWLWIEGVLFLLGAVLMPVSVFILMSADLKSAWTFIAVMIFFAGMMISVFSVTDADLWPPSRDKRAQDNQNSTQQEEK
jgi:hypothetical protein